MEFRGEGIIKTLRIAVTVQHCWFSFSPFPGLIFCLGSVSHLYTDLPLKDGPITLSFQSDLCVFYTLESYNLTVSLLPSKG